MPAGTIKRVKGLMLGRTPEQTDDLWVIKGRNFMPFLEGPRSFWGSQITATLRESCYYGMFAHDGKGVILTDDGVYQLDENCCLTKVFNFDCIETKRKDCDFEYPWTSAFVGDSWFYSHPRIGIIEYDTFTKEWCQLPRKALGFSDLIFGITQAAGSLIVLSRDTVTWSEFDNGKGLIENEYTGVGSQSLHLANGGQPLGVYSDGEGWFTFTENGAMYSRPLSSSQIISGENVEGSAVYRHDSFPTEDLPLSPYAIANLSPSLIAYVGQKGLHQVGRHANNQFANQVLDPVMSRWLREKLFPCFSNITNKNWLRLFYDKSTGYLFMSFSENNDRVYNESFVYDKELEEWGVFSEPHKHIGVIGAFASNQAGHLGYIDAHDFVHQFYTNANYKESDYGQLVRHPIDSFVDIGIIKLDDDLAVDYQSSIDGIVIETDECRTDFDVNVMSYLGTCEDDCEPNVTCDPYLYESRNCSNYYTCSNLGTNHILRITANKRNQSFALKTLRLNIKKRGKL